MEERQRFAKQPLSLLNAAKGVGVGIANIIPGVSGGTIAVITGLYDELVDGFGNFFTSDGGWKRNVLFLAPVIVGILAGNILFAWVIGWLLDRAPGATTWGFIGLIVGSLPYLVRRADIQSLRWHYPVLFLAGLGVVLWMGLTPRPAASPPITELTALSALWVFIAAFIASIAMIIPGVSGSFLLLLIGMYSTLQNSFSTLNVPVILVFVGGTLVGVVMVSKGIAALLRSFHGSTYVAIMGLVVGSGIALFPGFGAGNIPILDILGLAVGLGLSLLLGTGMKERLLKRG